MGEGLLLKFLSYDPCEHGTIEEFTDSYRPSQLKNAGGDISAMWLSVHADGPRPQHPTRAALAEGRKLVRAYRDAGAPSGPLAKKLVRDLHQLAASTG